jgi:DNA mismatch repair protein MutS
MDMEEDFVPNDLVMDSQSRMIILTGPNMAGKSTVMRQVALIVLLAQIGSFVPADFARIGMVDRVLVRVGASDDLAHGRSTFMVEMSETAHILKSATRRSLILLDEIGRGTSTFDGLSIAWSVAEAIHDQLESRTIFATHYHELSQLADERSSMRSMHVAVSEWQEEIVFLRTLRSGGASRSHGIQCARLAGVPATVIDRAKEILAELESRGSLLGNGPQLSLFRAKSPPDPVLSSPDPVRLALQELNPDDMSPRQALEHLYSLRALMEPS